MNSAFITYFREAIEDLHKVTWLTRDQAIRISIITIIFTIITAFVFGVFDFLFTQAAQELLKLSR